MATRGRETESDIVVYKVHSVKIEHIADVVVVEGPVAVAIGRGRMRESSGSSECVYIVCLGEH